MWLKEPMHPVAYATRSIFIMTHRSLLFIIPFIVVSILQPVCSAEIPPLVPLPAKVTPAEGKFQLDASTAIVAAKPEEKMVADMLASWLRPTTGLALPVKAVAEGRVIRLSIDTSLSSKLGREGYLLDCTAGGVTIRAAEGAGLFYGAQTFRQLLPPQACGVGLTKGVEWIAPAVNIEDRPRFMWRGFMLDVSRHFFTVDYIKSLIDSMAGQKLNLLQLHLTDDDGWRIEIKKYPKLTEIGAWRGTKCVLPNTRQGETHARYGGFYTQQQLKDLVAYAKARNIEIMPEMDLPGHALAIVTAYPETLPSKLADAVSAQGFSANAISPAKEANYRMIDDIIGEIAAIFPFAYIHIGGDEVNHKVWEACPEIKHLMEREKLGNLHQMQVHFTRRLEGILTKHGRKMIGWQEIADDRLSKQTGIMAWIGPEPGWNAAKRGAPAVMAPGGSFYFDMACPGADDEPPAHWWAGQVGLARAYEFDPLDPKAGLDAAAKPNILGVQAALWTEFVTAWKSKSGWLEVKDEGECADYKIWPRLCATAETAWTPQEQRDFTGFSQRMGGQYLRMAAQGHKFRLEPPTAKLDKGLIHIIPAWPAGKVKYTLDGSDPFNSPSTKIYDGSPIEGRYRSGLTMRSFIAEGNVHSPIKRGATIAPAGTWDVAAWVRDQPQTLVFPAGGHIQQPGRWKIRMTKTAGKDGLVVDRMTLRAAGVDLATATPSRAGNVVLEVKATPPAGAELVIMARFTGDKSEAKGNVLVEKLTAEIIAGLKVETKVPLYGEAYEVSQLLDGDPETFCWTSRNMEADETLTWIFPEAIPLKRIELQSGQPNSTKDQILDAVLEISTDGVIFTKASGFTYGAAKADLAGKVVKAVRLRATAKSPGWVVVQDLILTRN